MSINIMLIDDDSDDREFFSGACQLASYDMKCKAFNGSKGMFLELKKSMDHLPDLILLDVNMPQISGWECLSLLKADEVYKTIPVIMYSTTSHKEEIDRAKELGALSFFTKPNDFPELIKSIEILAKHIQNNSLESIYEESNVFL
jgi:CheY-like chemotaxis protein